MFIYIFFHTWCIFFFPVQRSNNLEPKKNLPYCAFVFCCFFLFVFKIQTETLSYVSDTLAFFASGNKDESWSFHVVSKLYISDSRHSFEYMIWFYCNLEYEPFSYMCARILKGKGWGGSWAFSVSSLRIRTFLAYYSSRHSLKRGQGSGPCVCVVCVFGFALVVSCWFCARCRVMPLKLFSLLVVFIVLQSLNPSSRSEKCEGCWILAPLWSIPLEGQIPLESL